MKRLLSTGSIGPSSGLMDIRNRVVRVEVEKGKVITWRDFVTPLAVDTSFPWIYLEENLIKPMKEES